MNQMSEYIGDRLAAIRHALGYKQQQFAKDLGCASNGAYSLYERNKRELPITAIYNLSSKFGVSPEFIIGIRSPQPFLIAERLRQAIKSCSIPNHTLSDFISSSDLAKETENLLLSGVCVPSLDMLSGLSAYFGCSIDFLLGHSDVVQSIDSIPIQIPTTSVPRNPYADLTPEHQAALEALATTFRQQEARDTWDSFPAAGNGKKG